MKSKRNAAIFYILSLTWGLPLTLVGAIAALILTLAGYRSKKWGYCRYFEVGENWGGLEMGIFFFTNKNSTAHIRNHEAGHGIQNCVLGPLMPFVVCIPSAVRYWYRRLRQSNPTRRYVPRREYDAVWFERQATALGTRLMESLSEKQNDLEA